MVMLLFVLLLNQTCEQWMLVVLLLLVLILHETCWWWIGMCACLIKSLSELSVSLVCAFVSKGVI